MNPSFELVQDARARFLFRLHDDGGALLLQGCPRTGKVAASADVMHARRAIRQGGRFVRRRTEDGRRFAVLLHEKGAMLARTTTQADDAALDALLERIAQFAQAPLLDHARA